ncbi:hypothetical protein [Thermostilla marina]
MSELSAPTKPPESEEPSMSPAVLTSEISENWPNPRFEIWEPVVPRGELMLRPRLLDVLNWPKAVLAAANQITVTKAVSEVARWPLGG